MGRSRRPRKTGERSRRPRKTPDADQLEGAKRWSAGHSQLRIHMRWAYNNYASYEFLVSTFYINIVDSHSVLYILYIFGRDVLSLEV